jgi:thioredoxin reductase (NADPH)
VIAARPRVPVRLTLYGRAYCHLCEDMRLELERLAPQLDFALDLVDVDEAEALEARYGELVPVLMHGDTEICHYFLDRAALADLFARIESGATDREPRSR